MTAQKVALIGAGGLLGTRVAQHLGAQKNIQLHVFSHAQADVTSQQNLHDALAPLQPDFVVNCAAFLNVDRCEKEPENSYKVNAQGAINAGQVAEKIGARLIHFSTDYVFDGKTGGYDEQAMPLPLCHYGLHKCLADEALKGAPAYILRVASLIGSSTKPDLVQALLARVAQGAPKLDVVDDMHISLSTTGFISAAVLKMIEAKPEFGIYNTVTSGQTTWLAIVREAFKALSVQVPLDGISASAFARPAARPQNSWLKNDKLARLMPIPTWQQAIAEQMAELKSVYAAILKQPSAA